MTGMSTALGPVAFPKLDPSLTTVRLVDGPCEGAYAQVPGTGVECWQRVGKPGGVGVESQMWARYDHNPLRRGEYVYSGVTIDTETFVCALAAMQLDGHTYGESYGA
jgi:hypothetical protein